MKLLPKLQQTVTLAMLNCSFMAWFQWVAVLLNFLFILAVAPTLTTIVIALGVAWLLADSLLERWYRLRKPP